MKKQELIHLHGLLAEVSSFCDSTTEDPIDLDEYRTLGIRPTSIHQSKTDHKAAVFALADGITTNLADETVEAVTTSAD